MTIASIDSLIEGFGVYLALSGRSENTIQNYRADLQAMVEWLDSRRLWPLDKSGAAQHALRTYRTHLVKETKPATVNRKLAAIKSFFRWAAADGRIVATLPRLKTVPVGKSRNSSWLDRRSQVKLLAALQAHGSLQEQIIVRFLIETGIHLSELCALRWENFETTTSGCLLRVGNEKMHRVRSITLSLELSALLKDFQRSRSAHDPMTMFNNAKGRITARSVQGLLERYSHETGEALTARILRHTFRRQWLQNQSDRSSMALESRHSSAATKDDAKTLVHPAGRPKSMLRPSDQFPVGSGQDSYQDMFVPDLLLSDPAHTEALVTIRSKVRRNPWVRKSVLSRGNGTCERCGYGAGTCAFLEVHHIIAVGEKVDREDNCVALCPNCHREAHTLPKSEAIEAELLILVRRIGGGVATIRDQMAH
jgi:site-specific recombinase XerD